MKIIITLLFLFLLYSCRDSSTTSPPSINYYTDDQQFIDDLVAVNELTEEAIIDRITPVEIDSVSIRYYQIKELRLGNMGLDSIPSSIGNLGSLDVLMLNDNNLQNLTESICTIYDQLDSLDVINNDICTPDVPDCIINSMTISVFYENQQCEIIPDEEDQDFIIDLINENWGDTASVDLISSLNNLTTWKNFIEGGAITSRITELRYNDKGIRIIPNTISYLDSLERIELQDNEIELIPNYIGSLSRLKYITIQKNNITSIPPRIGELKELEVFIIFKNQLDSLHENIGQLSKLTTLYLSENQLKSLPDSMCNILSNPYIDINVDYNQICIDYPECFTDLIKNSHGQNCP